MTWMIATSMTVPTVATVMTHRPVAVREDTPFHSVAALLSANRIGAVPVIDDSGAMVGVVSEMDLVRAGLHANRSLGDLVARELMSAPPATVGMADAVPGAARRLADPGVRRLFVVEDGRLTGVVSRRDLLRSYLRDDEDIRVQVELEVLAQLPGDHTVVRASVTDGVVLLVGRVEWRSALAGIDALVRVIPGVVEVRDRIGYQWDDGVGSTETSPR
jgi:CBS domain-containing protein